VPSVSLWFFGQVCGILNFEFRTRNLALTLSRTGCLRYRMDCWGMLMRLVLYLALLVVFGCGGTSDLPPVEEVPVVETGIARFGQSEIYYEVAGSGEPTIVLIHGGLLDCHMWDEQFELLAKTHRVLRYDASAHGNSTLPPNFYWDHADLRELLNTLGIERAVLVGLSLGGRIAIDFALEEPERVEAIVAVSSGLSGYRFTSDYYIEYRDVMIQAWRAGEFDAVVEAFLRSWTDGPHRQPEQVDPEVREKVRVMARNGLEHAMEGRLIDPPAIERLDELGLPMLIVVGEFDLPGIREIADMVVAANPNAELVVVPDVAHMVNLEAPEAFNRLLLDYLSGF
jgi:3-oxoadipate enol-lactonase